MNAGGVRSYFERRFGVRPRAWDDLRLEVTDASVFVRGPAGGVELDWAQKPSGLRVARPTTNAFKPSTRGVQWLGGRIRRNRIPLSERGMEAMLDRRLLREVDTDRVRGRGYVAVFFRGWAAGCCFWTGEALRTQLPKGTASQFPRAVLHEEPSDRASS